MRGIKKIFFICQLLLFNCNIHAMKLKQQIEDTSPKVRTDQIAWTFEALIVFLHTSGSDLFDLCGIEKLSNNHFVAALEQKKLQRLQSKIKQIDVSKYIKKRLASTLYKKNYDNMFIKKIEAVEVRLKEALTIFFNKHKWPTSQIESLATQLSDLEEQIIRIKENPKLFEDEKNKDAITLPATAIFNLLVILFRNAKIII